MLYRQTGFAVALLGGLVLLGWAFDLTLLKSVFPGLVTMKANTAAAFLLGGTALLLSAERADLGRRRAAQACAAVIVLLGALTLAENLLGWDLGIDQLLFRSSPGEAGTAATGRMAPETASSFVLLGLALLLLDRETRGGHRPAQALALLAGLVALLALLGYLYGVGVSMRMALHTAAASLLLSLGVLAARPESGWMALFTRDTGGALVARRLLAPVVLLPMVLGWLRLEGERAGLFGLETGLAFFAFANIVVLSALLLGGAQALDHVEARRRKADTLFRSLVEFAPDATVLVDRSGAIQLVNAQTERMFGYERGALVGQPIELLIPERFRSGHAVHRGGYAAAPRPRAMRSGLDLHGRRRDGTEFPVEVSLSPVEMEEGPFVASFIRDITERVAAAEALRERIRAVELVFEHSLGSVVMLDRNFNFIRVNQAYARACGRDVSDFPGRNHFDLYPSDARAIFEDVVRTKQPFRVTAHPFVFPDHPEWSETYWDWTLVPVADASGEVELLLFSLNDVTERMRAEKNLRATKRRLRALSHRLLEMQEAERRHLARELHDQMGQSITAIKLSLEAALRFPDGPGLDTHLSEAVSLLERLLSDVRSLSLQLRPALLEELGLNAAIRSLVEQQAGRAGLAFRFEPLRAPNRLESDLETACFRVAQEAVTNVLRHSRANSLEVALRIEGEQLHLVVRDDGTGFDPDEVHRRVDRSPGFGLSSMEERALLAGGQLTIHTRPGAGTEVHAVFPTSSAGPRKPPGEVPEQ